MHDYYGTDYNRPMRGFPQFAVDCLATLSAIAFGAVTVLCILACTDVEVPVIRGQTGTYWYALIVVSRGPIIVICDPESARNLGWFNDRNPFWGIHYFYTSKSRRFVSMTSVHWIYWFAAFAPLPARRVWRWHRGSRPLPAGTCRECGYDVRASPDRCPECGMTR